MNKQKHSYSAEEQRKVWNAIAPEWHAYKEKSSEISKDFLSRQKGNILDLGSGSGRHLTQIKNGKMTLVDFSEDMIELARKKAERVVLDKSNPKGKKVDAEFIVADISELPFEDNTFDGAISISSIHCLPKMQHKKIVKELYRVLKPKAQALIGVWNIESKRFRKKKEKERYIGWTDKGKRFYYLFNEKEIHDLFKKAGFKIISTHNSEMMINFIVEKQDKKDKCPFGEKVQKYWDKRYQYFSKFDEGIQTDKEGLYSVIPEEVANKQTKFIKSKTIIDAFGGIGGNAIAFARGGKKVFFIEKNKKRLNMAKNNARVYGVDKDIKFIHGDFFKEAPKIKAEAVYIDPPWGGPEYSNLQKFKLNNFSPNGGEILKLAFEYFSEIIIRVPTNFDFEELKKFGKRYKVMDDVSDSRIISRTLYFN